MVPPSDESLACARWQEERRFRGTVFHLEFVRLAGSCVAIAWRCRPGPPSAATAPEAPVARAEVFQDGTTEVVLEPFRFTNPVALTALAELLAYLHDRGRQSLASS